jgi:Uma2 family endonuclease
MTYSTTPPSDSLPSEIIYPDSDGKPMADNTKQYRWIVMIKENLEIFLAEILDVFIAGDLLWYPIEGDNSTRIAPDVMVVFGRPRGDRGSYQQWKEQNIAPQVVFEILSPGNSKREMQDKRDFYEIHGVEEFYVYDPDRLRLSGWIRQSGGLLPIANLEGWVSPRLTIRFTQINGNLDIYRPDGRRFLTSLELEDRAKAAETDAQIERDRASQAQVRADEAEFRADEAESRADEAEARAQQERIRAEQEKARADRLAEQLRALGIDPGL